MDKGPIVNISRIKKPGQRRQLLNVFLVIAGFLVILTVAYFVFSPREDRFVLKEYESAQVVLQPLTESITVSGDIEISGKETITLSEAGILQSLGVEEGDNVTAGQIVGSLSNRELDDQLVSDKRDLMEKFESLDILEARHTRNLEDIEKLLQRLTDDYADIQQDYEEYTRLYELESVTFKELQSAEDNLRNAEDLVYSKKRELESAVFEFDLSKRSVNLEIKILQEKIARLDERMNSLVLRSPINGQVVDLKVQSGSFLGQWSEAMVIADLSRPYLKIHIPERDVDRISPGQQAVIKIGSRDYSGFVRKLDLSASSSSATSGNLISGEVTFSDIPEKVIPGTSAKVEIVTGVVENALTLPRGPYMTTGRNKYVYRIEDKKAVKTDVIFGKLSGNMVEIVKGLKENDLIIISGYQEFIDKKEAFLQ